MFTSQAYTDRSNCRKAMKAHAEKTGTDLAFYTVRLVPGGRYVFEVPGPDAAPVNPTFVPPTAPEAEPPVKARRSKAKRIDALAEGPAAVLAPKDEALPSAAEVDGDIPEFLRRSAKENGERRAKMATVAPPAPEKPAKPAKPAKVAKVAKPGERARYDWKAADEAAASGVMPAAPDFSADTHKHYRPKLAALVALAEARDAKGLKGYNISGNSTSPKALKRFRDMSIKALQAKA